MKQYVFGLFKKSKVKGKIGPSMETIMKTLIWSLQAGFNGKWPAANENGRKWRKGTVEAKLAGSPLAGGFRMVLWSLKGDLDHVFKSYGCCNYNSNSPCEYCPCDRSNNKLMLFNYFGLDAMWKKMVFSPGAWRKKQMAHGAFVHWLFLMLPYLSVHNLEPDELHVLYLGVLQQMFGSVLFVLCFHVMPGTSTENVKAAWTSICRFYRVHSTKTQFTNMRLSSFHEAGEYPKLKGKGAEIKDLTPALLELWMEHSNPMEQEHLLISGMLQSQCVANDILHEFKDEMLLPLEKAK